MVKQAVIVILLIFAWLPAAPVKSVSQFGITWTFDQEYKAGQFCNGDWWVIGPIKIIKINPAATSNPDLHGSMLNPICRNTQGYDSRCVKGGSYNSALNVAKGISSSNPLALGTGNSLVSCISKPTTDKRPYVQTAAVLTVLAQAPAAGSFRPSFAGTDKTVRFNKNQLDYGKLLKLNAAPAMPTWSSMEHYFARPWTDHAGSGYMHQYMAAGSNMPNYGREVAARVSLATVMLNVDVPNAQKEKTVIGLTQVGIDLYRLVQNGATSRWAGGGGHNSGRKMPILFAGMMLGDNSMLNVNAYFQEDDQTYYGKGWTGATALWSPNHRTRANVPGGSYEHKHPSEWTVDGRGLPGDPNAGSNSDMRAENYRQCCNGHVWVGQALAARLMGLQDAWDHPPFFDYVDRWMNEKWFSFADSLKLYCGKTQGYYQGDANSNFEKLMYFYYRDYNTIAVRHPVNAFARANELKVVHNPCPSLSDLGQDTGLCLYNLAGKIVSPQAVSSTGLLLIRTAEGAKLQKVMIIK